MTALVNLTLAGSGIKPTHAVAALRAIGGVEVLLAHLHGSTLVAEVRRPLHASAAYAVASQLHVGAVRQTDGREVASYGPEAVAWFGEPFVNLDGGRLAA